MTDMQADPAMQRMQELLDRWQAVGDRRAVFAGCYRMMTGNMLAAITRQEFCDPAWVRRLLHRFADYYFAALEVYDQDRGAAPLVWQLAFNAARQPRTLALQNLLLGVNAHINYDLVLALVDILEAEWAGLPEEQRARRYEDHCQVNRVLGMTIDAVQDQVLEPAMPAMDIFDKLMGPVDEFLITRLLGHWRESVWHEAVRLLETPDPGRRAALVKEIEAGVLQLGELIQLKSFTHEQSGVSAGQAPLPGRAAAGTPPGY